MKPKKSWRGKLADDIGQPKVCEVAGRLAKRWGMSTFVIPAPSEVGTLTKRVPKGRIVTVNELHDAPAATEAEAAEAERITACWRTLKSGGELNPEYPGGVEGIAKRLRAEGCKVIPKRKRFLALERERKLFKGLH